MSDKMYKALIWSIVCFICMLVLLAVHPTALDTLAIVWASAPQWVHNFTKVLLVTAMFGTIILMFFLMATG